MINLLQSGFTTGCYSYLKPETAETMDRITQSCDDILSELKSQLDSINESKALTDKGKQEERTRIGEKFKTRIEAVITGRRAKFLFDQREAERALPTAIPLDRTGLSNDPLIRELQCRELRSKVIEKMDPLVLQVDLQSGNDPELAYAVLTAVPVVRRQVLAGLAITESEIRLATLRNLFPKESAENDLAQAALQAFDGLGSQSINMIQKMAGMIDEAEPVFV